MPLARRTVEGYVATPCLYCGMTATSRDHFVPRSYRICLTTWRSGIWMFAPDTVPCCTECNSTAGAQAFPTVAAKRSYILERYRRKYARLLARPFFTEDELDEFGPTLRSSVEYHELQKLRLILRLAWPYELGNEVGSLVQYILRGEEHTSALNHFRRREILAA